VDISLHGVRLNCHGPLKQGQVLNLTLESDTGSVSNIVVRGRVAWCRENERSKGHMVGVEFSDLSPENTELIERYHKSLAGRLRGNVMHRQIADGESVARPSDNQSNVSGANQPASIDESPSSRLVAANQSDPDFLAPAESTHP